MKVYALCYGVEDWIEKIYAKKKDAELELSKQTNQYEAQWHIIEYSVIE